MVLISCDDNREQRFLDTWAGHRHEQQPRFSWRETKTREREMERERETERMDGQSVYQIMSPFHTLSFTSSEMLLNLLRELNTGPLHQLRAINEHFLVLLVHRHLQEKALC